MPTLWMDVDTALSEVPVNTVQLVSSSDFKTVQGGVAYNAAGMDLKWCFVTTAGAYSETAVTPTDGGNYDWNAQSGAGMYTIEIPASGGASINNDTEGFGYFVGQATGILPWRGPTIGFRAAALNNSLIDAGTTGLLAPTTAARTLDVTATGAAGIDWANVENPTTTLNLSGTSTLALEPTTAGRKLDVSAGGEAGLDWANIGSPTTAQNLSATNIDVDQIVASVSGAVGSVTGAVGSVTGNVGGNVTGSVGSVVGAVGSVTGNVGGNVVGSVGSVTGNVGGDVVGAVGSVTGDVGGDVVGTVASVVGDVGGDVTGSVGSVVAEVDANITSINGTTVTGDGSGTPWGPA